jgi:hypothetical protein
MLFVYFFIVKAIAIAGKYILKQIRSATLI